MTEAIDLRKTMTKERADHLLKEDLNRLFDILIEDGLPIDKIIAVYPDKDPRCILNFLVNPNSDTYNKAPLKLLTQGVSVSYILPAAKKFGEMGG